MIGVGASSAEWYIVLRALRVYRVHPPFGANFIKRRGDSSMHTAMVCQRTRLRGSTAPLRQDFAHCIEPDTEERQAKSLGERGQGLIRGQG